MEPKKPRNKTVIFIAVTVLILLAVGFYYATALTNSDNRPASVERQS